MDKFASFAQAKLVRKSLAVLSLVMVLFGSVGPSFIVPTPTASAALSTVTLADNDTTGYGLDGRDFSISWTNDGNTPAGYVSTQLFVTEGTTADSLTTGNILSTGCGGGACIPLASFEDYENPLSETLFSSPFDSEQNAWTTSTKTYKACVYVDATTDELVCSDAVAYDGTSPNPGPVGANFDNVADTEAPHVHHPEAHVAYSGVAPVFSAIVYDEQTDVADFDDDAARLVLYYSTDLEASQNSVNAAQDGSGNFFTFTLPNQGADFEYYIKASDGTNDRFICGDGGTNDATCRQNPFLVDVVTAGTTTVSGTVINNVFPLAGAKVFMEGFAIAPATSGVGTGAFSFSNALANQTIHLGSYADNKCQIPLGDIFTAGDQTGIPLVLADGFCNFDGDGEEAHVVFTGPPQNADFVPLDTDIRIGFSKGLNDGLVATGTNMLDSANNPVSISAVFCTDNNDQNAGCSNIPEQDQNVILITPNSALTANTSYVITLAALQDEDGQFVEPFSYNFTTGGGTHDQNDINTNFGNTGEFMPPFVTGMIPAPGIKAARNVDIVAIFNEPMDGDTIDSSSVDLYCDNEEIAGTVSFNTNTRNLVTFNPSINLSPNKECELRLAGSIANASGITMRRPGETNELGFIGNFETGATSDSTAPTITPFYADGATGIPVNDGFFEYAFSEQPHPDTLDANSIQFKRGSTDVPFEVEYDPGPNSVFLSPSAGVLAPNATYTVTFTTAITDLAGNALGADVSYNFTTGSADSTAPTVERVRCDDFRCTIFFDEPMDTSLSNSSTFSKSVLNVDHYGITTGAVNPTDTTVLDIDDDDDGGSLLLNYDPVDHAVTISGFATPLTLGHFTQVSVETTVTDASANAVASQIDTVTKIEPPGGEFDGGGMFQRPPQDNEGHGGLQQATSFGAHSADDFFFGNANVIFPFNAMASQDSNVMHVEFNPGVAVADNYQVVLTFPRGFTVSNTTQDTFSPFKDDFNDFADGTITFDSALDSDGIDVSGQDVIVQMAVTGNPDANAPIIIDLKGIVNPSIAKGPDTGGYTVEMKLLDTNGQAIVNETSLPIYISAGGSNDITIDVQTSGQDADDDGDIFLFGGGPAGPMDKNLTLANGDISAVDGAVATEVEYNNVPDGCYFFGTEPQVDLGSTTFFGQEFHEPICVFGGESKSKTFTLTSAESNGAAVELNVVLAGTNGFAEDTNVELFAGCPGSFTSINLDDINSNTTAELFLRSSGMCFVGIGPELHNGASAQTGAKRDASIFYPAPIDIDVDVTGDAIKAGFHAPPGVSLNTQTKTVTFTFSTADKAITGTVVDGSDTALEDIEVFVHSNSFGAPSFATTDSNGAFTVNVADLGTYEIGAFKEGLQPTFQTIEVRSGGDIYQNGKQITIVNPLKLKVKKPDYSISGKVLDASNNPVSNAPIFATSTDGDFIPAGTDSNGNYTIFVDQGTWTIEVELPPSEAGDNCADFSETVTVTNQSLANQNVTPQSATCVTLSGTISVGGSPLGNIPAFLEQCTGLDTPTGGGFFKPISTNSAGEYETKVLSGRQYCLGTFDPTVGEIRVATSGAISANTTLDINEAAAREVTFAFTGGDADMDAYIELKDADNPTVRNGSQETGLDENKAVSISDGSTEYFVQVPGVGKFSGTVDDQTDTVTIDLSSKQLSTFAGNVKDENGNNLSGAMVTLKDTTNDITKTVKTDENGDYSVDVAGGSDYEVDVKMAGYLPPSTGTTIDLTNDVSDFNFGGNTPDVAAMTIADKTISGTVYENDGSTAVEEGFVRCADAAGLVSMAAIESDGSYEVPVDTGTWTCTATTDSGHEPTSIGSFGLGGSDVAGKDFTLDAANDKTASSKSVSVGANTGGTLNDPENGIKMAAGAGVLETGSGNVTVTGEKKYLAPDTENFEALGDVAFSMTATSSDSTALKSFNGNVDLTFDYTEDLGELPVGVSEEDLFLLYLDPTTLEYKEVEGGFVVDPDNNTIAGAVNHFTDFVIGYNPPSSGGSSNSGGSNSGSSGGVGGSVSSNSDLLPAADLEVNDLPETTQTESLAVGEDGDVEEFVTLVDEEGTAAVTVPAETKVTDADGNPYAGELEPPRVVELTSEAPADYEQTGEVYEIGLEGQSLNFSQPIEVRIPLPESVTANDVVKVYYYDEEAAGWKLAGNGGRMYKDSEGNLVMIVSVDHLTKFATFRDTTVVVEDTEIEHPFVDVVGHWGEEFIAMLYSLEIVSGRDATHYAPNDKVTRAEFTKIAIELLDIELLTTGTNMFSDVASDAWHAEYVATAYNAGIVNGYEDGTFRPNDEILRAEALKILLEAAEIELPAEDELATDFSDVSSSDWFFGYVALAAANEIVSGYSDGSFGPGNNLTRAEAAKIAAQLLTSDLVSSQ